MLPIYISSIIGVELGFVAFSTLYVCGRGKNRSNLPPFCLPFNIVTKRF